MSAFRRSDPQNKQTAAQHADRNAQFEKIAQLKEQYIEAGRPVISIDTNKKRCSELSTATAKHYIEKTEATTGLNVVVRILDKVYESVRKYAEDFEKTMTIKFGKHLAKNGTTPQFPIQPEIGKLFRDCSLAG